MFFIETEFVLELGGAEIECFQSAAQCMQASLA